MNIPEVQRLITNEQMQPDAFPPHKLSVERKMLWKATRELYACARHLQLYAGPEDHATWARCASADALSSIIDDYLRSVSS